MKSKLTAAELADLVRVKGFLEKNLQKGDSILVATTRYSASGMTRWCRVYCAPVRGRVEEITGAVCVLRGLHLTDDGLKVPGTGFGLGGDVAETICVALGWHMKDLSYNA